MTFLLFLFALLLGDARAADALPTHQQVRVETGYDGRTQILDHQLKPLTPQQFAHRIGDFYTADRYRRSYRLHKTASIMMWVYGGVGIVGGFYLTYFTGIVGVTTGDERFLAGAVLGLGFMASGIVSLPLGFVWFFNGKKVLNDPLNWWRIGELHGLADSYNAGQTGRRIEVRPIVSPEGLALNLRF